jgi:hypothetical protein
VAPRLSRFPFELDLNAELTKPTEQLLGETFLVALALHEVLTP